jgi:hypothetical protein
MTVLMWIVILSRHKDIKASKTYTAKASVLIKQWLRSGKRAISVFPGIVVPEGTQMLRIVLALALICSPLGAISQEASPAQKVNVITIEEHGRSEHHDDIATQTCKTFSLRHKEIRNFLQQAVEVDSGFHTQEHYSPCYVSGIVEYADGSKGQWQIHSGRTGILKTQDGRTVTLYCSACRWKDPFTGGYANEGT